MMLNLFNMSVICVALEKLIIYMKCLISVVCTLCRNPSKVRMVKGTEGNSKKASNPGTDPKPKRTSRFVQDRVKF